MDGKFSVSLHLHCYRLGCVFARATHLCIKDAFLQCRAQSWFHFSLSHKNHSRPQSPTDKSLDQCQEAVNLLIWLFATLFLKKRDKQNLLDICIQVLGGVGS